MFDQSTAPSSMTTCPLSACTSTRTHVRTCTRTPKARIRTGLANVGGRRGGRGWLLTTGFHSSLGGGRVASAHWFPMRTLCPRIPVHPLCPLVPKRTGWPARGFHCAGWPVRTGGPVCTSWPVRGFHRAHSAHCTGVLSPGLCPLHYDRSGRKRPCHRFTRVASLHAGRLSVKPSD